jgi:SET domain-containing protein
VSLHQVVPLTLRVEDSRAVNEPNLLWTEEEMRKLPKEKLEATLWGGYAHDPSQKWIELRDGASFTNHSDKPNCEANWSDDPWDEEMTTIRDIKAGEEIFEDYGCVAPNNAPSLHCLSLCRLACVWL